MRPKKHKTTRWNDLFWSRPDQIINMKHELVALAGKIDWDWIDGEVAPPHTENGRPGIETRFMIGLPLLKHIYGLCDEGVCERWVHDRYFQLFTGKEFFQNAFPHGHSDLSHRRKRLGDKLELLLAESLRVAHEPGALRGRDLEHVAVDATVQLRPSPFRSMPSQDQGAEPRGQTARRQPAAILLSRGQGRGDDGCPLRPCQTVQAASAARSRASQRWRKRLHLLSAEPARSAHNSSASATGSFVPSMPRRWSASARARPPSLTSSG
nr:hypothetical protein in nfe locus ORFA [Bradyrhizobium sp. DOA9]